MRHDPIALHDQLAVASAAIAQLNEALQRAQDAMQAIRNDLCEARMSVETRRGDRRVAEAIRTTAFVCGMTVDELRSDRRAQVYFRPRALAYLAAKKFTKASLPQIGRALGGRDHTSVIHGLRRAEELVAQDDEAAAWWAEIERRLAQ